MKVVSFNSFYKYYLTQHLNPVCRAFHYMGTLSSVAVMAWTIIAPVWWKIGLIPLVGYGFSWIGHFLFEKNQPAAFKNPLYSLASDFLMCYHFISGQLFKKLAESKNNLKKPIG